MLSLRDAQQAIAETLRSGPVHCPAGLFAGSFDHTLLALKVHANTVSHARLIALEETFPHTRAVMGESAFNSASRAWLDAGHGSDCPLALIGEAFPDWLANQCRAEPGPESNADQGSAPVGDEPLTEERLAQHDVAGRKAQTPFPVLATLARFEWLWLESYHAAEALPLRPDASSAIAPEAVLALVIAQHPAARLTACDATVANVLGLTETPSFVLIARPYADVLVHPLTAPLARLFALFDGVANLGVVLETFWTEFPNDDAVAGINHLISLGVLTMETAS